MEYLHYTVFKNQNLIYNINVATEIELKAHVVNYDKIKRLLFINAEYLGAFEKYDTYWYPEGGACPGLPPSGLRVRKENRTFPDGIERVAYLVTYKTKERKNEIEINEEKEFEATSLRGLTAPVFEEFLKLMGLKPGNSKKKNGMAFFWEGINAELSDVEGLGWFIELEIVSEDYTEENYEKERNRLLHILELLGIEKEAIENRFYSEMLSTEQ